RLALKAAGFQKTRAPKTIEWVQVIGTPEHRFESGQQYHHREHVLAVVDEHRIEHARITVAQPGEIATRDHGARQIVGAMQVEHRLFNGLEGTVRQAGLEDSAGKREEIEVWRRGPGWIGPLHH